MELPAYFQRLRVSIIHHDRNYGFFRIPISELVDKQVLDFIILMLYRYGGNSGFLGIGGTWNLNEVKNPDVEIIASGVFIGYFIYTSVILIAFCFGTTKHKASVVVSYKN